MAGAAAFHRRFRQNIRRERIFRDRSNPLDFYDDTELLAKYRFRRPDILDLVDELRATVEHDTERSGALPASMQICIALRFYATGSFQDILGDISGVSQPTVSRVITKVTRALCDRMAHYIKFPTQAEADQQKLLFHQMARFPSVFACIDGTHIRIQAPRNNEHEYVNRKNYHSVNVQMMCTADLKIINCIARWPGAVHDARILRECRVFQQFEQPDKPVQGLILGDSGYMLRDWLLTPFLNVATPAEAAYNDSHRITRCTIERSLGVIKRRWHCLHGELRLEPAKVCQVVIACVMLHNKAIDLRIPPPDEALHIPHNEIHHVYNDNQNMCERARTAAGKAVRDRIVQTYFQQR